MNMNIRSWAEFSVLVTGASGTIGREIVSRLADIGVSRLVGVDNNESEIFYLSEQYQNVKHLQFYVADVRDRDRMEEAMCGHDVVIHAAALKHVYICERSPRDAVQTNVQGTLNVIEAARSAGVKRVIFTSSDKAVNPTGVLGTSKLMGERLITAAANQSNNGGPIFASTRFGNVIGSRGSVAPLFYQQISTGGPVTLTNNDMTRFMMTLREAADLVLESAFLAVGGEIFVPKMPVIRMPDLAAVMIEIIARKYDYSPTDIVVKTIGARAGEKFYEELLNDEEIRRAIELENVFVIIPTLGVDTDSKIGAHWAEMGQPVERPYKSSVEPPMSQSEIRDFLQVHNVLSQLHR